jgi:hypothetical protein
VSRKKALENRPPGWVVAPLLALVLLGACRQVEKPAAGPQSAILKDAATEPSRPIPPAPPILEDFEGPSVLPLFPRLGDYRPETEDQERLPYWHAYLDHLNRTAGIVQVSVPLDKGGRVFSFRSVAGIDSVGFFSPLAVTPETTYRVSASVHTDLPEGGEAGIGILEFDEFLWVAEQYPRSLAAKHHIGAQPGLVLTGHHDWTPQSFTFTTGSNTRMVHLVFYREGTQDRTPVRIDDISIEKLTP